MNVFISYEKPGHRERWIDIAVEAIKNSPDGIVVTPDGDTVSILSNRDTEAIMTFRRLFDDKDFREMSVEEIREFMRSRAAEVGMEGLKI